MYELDPEERVHQNAGAPFQGNRVIERDKCRRRA